MPICENGWVWWCFSFDIMCLILLQSESSCSECEKLQCGSKQQQRSRTMITLLLLVHANGCYFSCTSCLWRIRGCNSSTEEKHIGEHLLVWNLNQMHDFQTDDQSTLIRFWNFETMKILVQQALLSKKHQVHTNGNIKSDLLEHHNTA